MQPRTGAWLDRLLHARPKIIVLARLSRLTAILAFAALLVLASQISCRDQTSPARAPVNLESVWRAPTAAELAEIEMIVAEAEHAEPGRREDILHDLLNDLVRRGMFLDGEVARRIERLVRAE